ncbi:thiolase family protein [Elongatibacter sediminis]|uniref:Thiolase family protein n=1 Tax=Elongatibacter sediminis TaxID=3119006 RepID=A0AAW9RAR2_9GAMM
MRKDQIDGLAISSLGLGPDGSAFLAAHFGLSLSWVEDVCLGGASAIAALRRAISAIQSGHAETVACIAGDGFSKEQFQKNIAEFSSRTARSIYPYGGAGPNLVFAMITRAYMEQYGAQREDFGRVCIAQRENASFNPHALFQKPLTMEEYLHARPVAEPLHLYDCVPPCAGAEGFLVTTTERARALNVPYVEVLASEENCNALPDESVQLHGGWDAFRDRLYERAAVGPRDMDFVQTYDDYPVMTFQQLEGLGFCDTGSGFEFVRKHSLTCTGGGLPMNTCGGQLSAGQAGFAGGFLGVVESIRQLIGCPLGRQVPRARLGLVSGFGMVDYDRGLCSAAAILRRADS